MSGHDLEPLSPDLEALLDSERRSSGAPAPARERLRLRLDRLFAGTANVLQLRPKSSVEGRADRSPLSSRPRRSAGGRLRFGLRTGVAALLGSAALAMASFGLGGLIGALFQSRTHLFGSPPVNSCPGTPVTPLVPGPDAIPPAPAAPAWGDPPQGGVLPAAPLTGSRFRSERTSVHPARARVVASRHPEARPVVGIAAGIAAGMAAPEGARDADLAEQRWLLERARAALSRGDGIAAVDALEEHQRRFPQGQLTEEREVLEIEASLALGRASEAKLRATEFERRHPGSLLLPAVDGALRSLP
jgi:hypothetical protein